MKLIFQKTTGLLGALFIMVTIIQAQAPNSFNYQAVARNSNGSVIANHAIGIQFTIIDNSLGTVYQETQTQTTNSLGLFTAVIGGGTVVSGTVAGVNWASDVESLKVEIDPTGGTNYTVTGTSTLQSVPYSLYANSAGSVSNGITGSGTLGNVPVFTGSNSIGNAIIAASDIQVGIGLSALSPYQGTLLSVSGGSGTGKDSATLYTASITGVALFANSISSDPTAVFQNTGTGDFADFGNGGVNPIVTVNSTSNGHGQVTVASDNTSNGLSGSINASILGLNTTFDGVTITQTSGGGIGTSFTPYTNDDCWLGLSDLEWLVVYAKNGTIQPSDSREKENVQPVAYGLNTIMQLNPVSFNWIDKRSQLGTGTNLGFIAQDVEKVLPDVVVHTIHTDTEIAAQKKDKGIDIQKDNYGVKYAEFTPVMVKAIQEQQQMIADLQKEVAALKAQLGSK